MKVQQLRLQNFTAFDDAVFDFCPGVNVLIGANATGKSHVLKAGYALQKSWDTAARSGNGSWSSRREAGVMRTEKLRQVFRPVDLSVSRLLREPKSPPAEVALIMEAGTVRVTIRRTAMTTLPDLRQRAPCVFLHARDVLALYEGFIADYENRELSFDETYYDLCLSLSAAPLRSSDWADPAIDELRRAVDGAVRLKQGRFYVGKLEAQLVAEGFRKAAQIVQLLRNGSITSESTLYWDEPEGGLNPRLIRRIVKVILELARGGVQIILASHDFLLTSELSLNTEHQIDKTNVPMRFFCLSRSSARAPVAVESADSLGELQHNPILEEFAAHYDRQHAAFTRG